MHAGQVCWRRIAQRIPGRPFDTRNEDNRSAGTVTRVFVEASFSSFNLQPKTGRDNSHSGAECAVCIYRIAFSICQERMRNYFRSAGWSSLVARQAHNLKAAGSNPAPATKSLAECRQHIAFTFSRITRASFISVSPTTSREGLHNTGQSRWTKGHGPWTIVWQSEELLLTDARKLENRLKRQGRGKGFYAITGLQRGSS